jgi:uncharacterized membrane protein YgaE (UPF0421/DUF939 family)
VTLYKKQVKISTEAVLKQNEGHTKEIVNAVNAGSATVNRGIEHQAPLIVKAVNESSKTVVNKADVQTAVSNGVNYKLILIGARIAGTVVILFLIKSKRYCNCPNITDQVERGMKYQYEQTVNMIKNQSEQAQTLIKNQFQQAQALMQQ